VADLSDLFKVHAEGIEGFDLRLVNSKKGSFTLRQQRKVPQMPLKKILLRPAGCLRELCVKYFIIAGILTERM
jgi:hypothetical protein